jgi:hypothetical protein
MNTYALDSLTFNLLNIQDTVANRTKFCGARGTFLSSYNEAYKEICDKKIHPLKSETVTLTDRTFNTSSLTYRPKHILYITAEYPDFHTDGDFAISPKHYFEEQSTGVIVVPYLNTASCNVTYEYVPADLVANLTSEVTAGNDTPSLIVDSSVQEALSYYAAYMHNVITGKSPKASWFLNEYEKRVRRIRQAPAPSDTRQIRNVW